MIKQNIITAIFNDLVFRNNYLLLSKPDDDLPNDHRVISLYKDTSKVCAAVDLIDGDSMTTVEIKEHLGKITGIRTIVFIFDNLNDKTKIDSIKVYQKRQDADRSPHKFILIDVSTKSLKRLYTIPFSTFDIIKSIRRSLNTGIISEFKMIFDLFKDNGLPIKTKKNYVTISLIAVNILILIWLWYLRQKTGSAMDTILINAGANDNGHVFSGEFWRLFVSVFLHHDAIQLILSSISLFIAGRLAERMYGHAGLLAIYFMGGIFANIFAFAFSNEIIFGSAYAICGVIGSLSYYFTKDRKIFLAYILTVIIIPAWFFIAIYYFDTNLHIVTINGLAAAGGLIGGFLCAGIYDKPDSKKLLSKRYIYLVLSAALVISCIFIGIRKEAQNKIDFSLRLMKVYEKSNLWNDAEKLAEEILDSAQADIGDRSAALYSVTISEGKLKKFDEAIGHAQLVVKADPPKGHYLLGVTYFLMADYSASKNELLMAKSLDADFFEIDDIINRIDKIMQN